jgi:Fe-S-cluster containining protein
MRIFFDSEDTDRVANYLSMSTEAFVEKYLESVDGESLRAVRVQPCSFLGPDDRCTIYPVRPGRCRGYPYTDQPGFSSRTYAHADNAKYCPAVFWIIEQMRHNA